MKKMGMIALVIFAAVLFNSRPHPAELLNPSQKSPGFSPCDECHIAFSAQEEVPNFDPENFTNSGENICLRRVRTQARAIVVPTREEEVLDSTLTQNGFNPEVFARLHEEYAAGKRPLRYLDSQYVETYDSGYVVDLSDLSGYLGTGEDIIRSGGLAIVVLKGGAATRLVGGGVDKAIVPMVFTDAAGNRKSLLEIHLASIAELKDQLGGARIQAIMSDSYLNDRTTRQYLEENNYFGLAGDLCTTVDIGVGKRLTPNPEDLEAEAARREEGMRAWEKMVAEQLLETEKGMVEGWVDAAEAKGAQYPQEYQPMGMDQKTKLHPLGHFQVLPALFLGGQLRQLIESGVEYLMIFNSDNVFNLEDMGVDVRPEVIGLMDKEGKDVVTEFTDRGSDVGGVLAKAAVQQLDADGKPVFDEQGNPVYERDEAGNIIYRHRILEGVISNPEVESEKGLDLINTATHYISIDGLLEAFGFTYDTADLEKARAKLPGASEQEIQREARRISFLDASAEEVRLNVQATQDKVERYTVIKRVSELLPDGREYKMPVIQFEQLLGDFPLLLGEGDWQPVYVPRIGEEGRFLPIKDLDTLTEIRMREALADPGKPSPLRNAEGALQPGKITEILQTSAATTEAGSNPDDLVLFSSLNYNELLQVVGELRSFIPAAPHLQQLRAFMYLYTIFLDYLPTEASKEGISMRGGVPTTDMLEGWKSATGTKDFIALTDSLYTAYQEQPSLTLCWWLSKVYRRLTREARLDQVEESMNKYLAEFLGPLPYTMQEFNPRLGGENAELKDRLMNGGAVRVDIGCRVELDSVVGSDIFGIAMDYPEGSQVINAAIKLRVRDPLTQTDSMEQPISIVVRKIDKPVIRLSSVDMGETYDYENWQDVRNITMDNLGLLKAALLATGVIPREPLWKMDEAVSYLQGFKGVKGLSREDVEVILRQPSEDVKRSLREKSLSETDIEALFSEKYMSSLKEMLETFLGQGGCGIEVITYVKDIAQGSGLAVSSSLAAGLGSALLQFRGTIDLENNPEDYRSKEEAVATALRMEWLEISGGGYQDMAAEWGGVHKITAVPETDPQATTQGELIPQYETLELAPETKDLLEKSIVIAHLGMAQAVGPMLDIITDSYYLRRAWDARKNSEALYERQIAILEKLNEIAPAAVRGDTKKYKEAMDLLREFGRNMALDYENRRAISPEATNMYGDRILEELQRPGAFSYTLWGWNTTGARAGAGHVFVIDPNVRDKFEQQLVQICDRVKKELSGAYRIAYPVTVYDWEISDEGAVVDVLDPAASSNTIDWLMKTLEVIKLQKQLHF